ncbi:hypothetical protein PROFUN_09401 [Planoprotostelium fungivorum]|uniref:Uncharacterized protein n=1 Tax=Planoprotostelium fungivorum TaxID=1890364 RepID=A0A2P6NHD9_9EUKA|nr:hypothetical protein PROFUN_09401 [Planoprotostelium fungivorum]
MLPAKEKRENDDMRKRPVINIRRSTSSAASLATSFVQFRCFTMVGQSDLQNSGGGSWKLDLSLYWDYGSDWSGSKPKNKNNADR